MRSKYYLSAVLSMVLVSCSSDYTSAPLEETDLEPAPLVFEAGYNRARTRADITGAAAATALGNYFRVYGVKHVGTATRTVFPNYTVEYDGTDGAGAALSTSTNTRGWEYVGLNNYPSQTLHYWDFAASDFVFQAWSPTSGNALVSVTSPTTLTISAPTLSDLSQFYLADLRKIRKTDTGSENVYGGVVVFNFRNMSAKVRLGIYETIPGYHVSAVTFRSPHNYFATSNSHALLEGSFNGNAEATGGIFHATYSATDARAQLATDPANATSNYHDFGTFDQGIIGTEHANPTWAGGTGAYSHVLPNEDHAQDMTICVDFTLTANDGSDDVLYVKGATVTVPASYMVWHPNYAYTYLFKITQDINGTTGDEGNDPKKLYPITFDAIVKEDVEAGAVERDL